MQVLRWVGPCLVVAVLAAGCVQGEGTSLGGSGDGTTIKAPVTKSCAGAANGTACSDGKACTTTDTCQDGVCVGTPVTCGPPGPCQLSGVCSSKTGKCTYAPRPNGTSCDDGNACTSSDACASGQCTGKALTCPAPGPCQSTGTCQASTGTCTYPVRADGTSCSDGDKCNGADVCKAGECTHGASVVCTALDQCHVAGTCNPNNGNCSNPIKLNGSDCSDGDACTSDEACQNGSCTGGKPVVCVGDQCHDPGTCDHVTGCNDLVKPDGTACTDLEPCTFPDTCQGGACVGGVKVECDDGNACTDDWCNATGGCGHSNNQAACSDGSLCTTVDVCTGGFCQGTLPVVCTAPSQCHTAYCDPTTGQCADQAQPDSVPCNDGDLCTQVDTCQAGVCVGTQPVVCTAPECYDPGTCAPATGLCSDPTAKADGAACTDGSVCTLGDTCLGAVCQAGTPLTCTALDQCHDPGTCDPITGCSDPAKPDGSACNDSDACTQVDTCQTGACQGSQPVVCTALDQCHDAGTCDSASGLCSNPGKPDGTACDDASVCTVGDTCQSAACQGGPEVTCLALDQCHLPGSCDPIAGCDHPAKPDGSGCSDGDACTQVDECQGGACTGLSPIVCLALDGCHLAGTCDPATGTCSDPSAPDGSGCSDGDACTQVDECQGGVCTGLSPIVCLALDGCHDPGVCLPAEGTCTQPVKADGEACDDGNLCTAQDHCQAGACTGTDCDDGNECTADSCTAQGCVAQPIDGQPCDQGAGVCSGGVCVAVVAPTVEPGPTITPDGSTWTIDRAGGPRGLGAVLRTDSRGRVAIVRAFSGWDGRLPQGGLVHAGDGALYGTTAAGGLGDRGVVFRLDPASGSFTVVVDFALTRLARPVGGLWLGRDGHLQGLAAWSVEGPPALFRLDRQGRLHSIGVLDPDGPTLPW